MVLLASSQCFAVDIVDGQTLPIRRYLGTELILLGTEYLGRQATARSALEIVMLAHVGPCFDMDTAGRLRNLGSQSIPSFLYLLRPCQVLQADPVCD